MSLGLLFYSPDGDLVLSHGSSSQSLKFTQHDSSVAISATDAKPLLGNGVRVDAVFGIVKFLGPRYLCVVTKSALVCKTLDGGAVLINNIKLY